MCRFRFVASVFPLALASCGPKQPTDHPGPGATASASAAGATTASASSSARASSSEVGSLQPDAVCAHVVETIRPELEAKRKEPLSQAQIQKAIAACVEGERAEQGEGEEHWRCRSKCLSAAKNGKDAMACDDSCALPAIALDCDAALDPSELAMELGLTVKLQPDSGKGTDTKESCTRDYVVADRFPGLLSIAVHRTRVDASAAVKEPDKNATDVADVPTLGDAAIHYQAPFEAVPLCHVRAAKGRVTLQLTAAQKKCPFEKLERVAAKVLSRLP